MAKKAEEKNLIVKLLPAVKMEKKAADRKKKRKEKMAIYKIERCDACNYKHHEPKPKTPRPCPRCTNLMAYLPNWYISYQKNGKKYVEAVGTQKRLAEDVLAKRKTQLREGKFFEAKREDVTWQEGFSRLRKSYTQPTNRRKTPMSPETIRMYENSLKIIEAHGITRILPSHYTVDDISDYIADRQAEGVTNSTINRELSTMKRIGHLSRIDALTNIQLLSENAARKRILSTDETKRLATAIADSTSPYLQLAILIALDTGLRKQSTLSLRWDEVDISRKLITKKGKGGKEAKVPITSRLLEILTTLKTAQKAESVSNLYLFGTPTGAPVKNLKTSFRTACRNAGITDIRWHDLRRTFSSNFISATRDLVALQQLLGHSDFNTTRKHYAHLVDDHITNAMNQYEKAMKSK